MSGAAANSAARRRRVGAQSLSDTPVTNIVKKEPAKPVHPLELLTLHDRRLFILEDILKNQIQSLLPNISETNTFLNTNDKTNEEYETKIKSLEDDVAQLKKLVAILQTFSMETNLAVSNLKIQTQCLCPPN